MNYFPANVQLDCCNTSGEKGLRKETNEIIRQQFRKCCYTTRE